VPVAALGYPLKGRVRVKHASGDEVLQAGDVYYLEPGHVPVFEEDTEVLEFSPKIEYQKTIEVAARKIAAMQGKA
jgi:quercetin dioxygenase-like cupin family protein